MRRSRIRNDESSITTDDSQKAKWRETTLFFFCAVGCTLGWTAVLSNLVYYTNTLGVNSYVILNMCVYAPLFPITIAQSLWDADIELRFTSMKSFWFKGNLGFGVTLICTIVLAFGDSQKDSLWKISLLSLLLGTSSGILHGSLKQMASFVYPGCGRLAATVTAGLQASAVFVLVVTLIFPGPTSIASTTGGNNRWLGSFYGTISVLVGFCWIGFRQLMTQSDDIDTSMHRRDSSVRLTLSTRDLSRLDLSGYDDLSELGYSRSSISGSKEEKDDEEEASLDISRFENARGPLFCGHSSTCIQPTGFDNLGLHLSESSCSSSSSSDHEEGLGSMMRSDDEDEECPAGFEQEDDDKFIPFPEQSDITDPEETITQASMEQVKLSLHRDLDISEYSCSSSSQRVQEEGLGSTSREGEEEEGDACSASFHESPVSSSQFPEQSDAIDPEETVAQAMERVKLSLRKELEILGFDIAEWDSSSESSCCSCCSTESTSDDEEALRGTTRDVEAEGEAATSIHQGDGGLSAFPAQSDGTAWQETITEPSKLNDERVQHAPTKDLIISESSYSCSSSDVEEALGCSDDVEEQACLGRSDEEMARERARCFHQRPIAVDSDIPDRREVMRQAAAARGKLSRRRSSAFAEMKEAYPNIMDEDSSSRSCWWSLSPMMKGVIQQSWPLCVAVFLTVASSMAVSSWFNRVPSTSEDRADMLPQVLFYTRLFADLLARPATLLLPSTNNSSNDDDGDTSQQEHERQQQGNKRTLWYLMGLVGLRLLFVPYFFIYTASTSLIPWRSDVFMTLGVFAFAFSSGFIVTWAYQLAPQYYRGVTTSMRDYELLHQNNLLNVCFSASIIVGLVGSLSLANVNFAETEDDLIGFD